MKAILCNKLFTSEEKDGDNYLNEQVIIIENEKISEVMDLKQFNQKSFNGEIIDCLQTDLFILPGLIDTHVHLAHGGNDPSQKYDADPLVSLRMAHNALINLKAGITTLRDLGAKNHIDIKFKEGVIKKLIPSPRLLVCGKPIIMTGGHCYYMGRESDGPDDVSRAVREQLKVGVDFIKLMVTGGVMTPGNIYDLQLKEEEIRSAVETAHNASRPVAAHAQAGKGIKLSIEAGIDTLEHGIDLSEADIELMYKKGTYYVPTLLAFKEIAEDGINDGLPSWMVDKVKAATEVHAKSFKMAKEAGITIAAGTDYRHGTLKEELKLMVNYGFTEVEAILSATRTAAKVINKDNEIGSIKPGKFADITIVKGDPLEDIEHLGNIYSVIFGGEIIN